uniref:Uncharacterized protein n=1 Tax=Setaria italica TaxID=4555 RepID=K3YB63_SETIT
MQWTKLINNRADLQQKTQELDQNFQRIDSSIHERGTRVSKQLSPSNSRANRGFSCWCLVAIFTAAPLVSSIFTCCLLLLLASAGTCTTATAE